MLQTVLFTAAGLGTLFLLGKAIGLATSGMPYGCWQSTAARAGASALVVGSLATMRRGNLALLGAGYALILLTSHASPLLLASAVIAGAVAYVADRVLEGRGLVLRVILVTLVFNLLLTLSGFIKALSAGDGRTGLAEYASGTGLRILSTLIVAVAVVLVVRLISSRRAA